MLVVVVELKGVCWCIIECGDFVIVIVIRRLEVWRRHTTDFPTLG